MRNETIVLLLCLCIAVLAGVIVYQQISFRRTTRRALADIASKLKQILDDDTDEGVLVFTSNEALRELSAQINRLLEAHKKVKAEFRHAEISSKKMLSNISHDIKTPMTVVLGYLEMLRLNGTAAPEMLEKAEQKAQSVMALINEFFTLAKLEAGDMDVTCVPLQLNEICRASLLDFYELLQQHAFAVEADIPETPVYAQANREAVRRILQNLIANAIRYGADGHYLKLSVRTQGAFALIEITDRGKGVEKAFAKDVFDRLFTMEDSRNRQVQGNGLGLTIAKNLALQMGGDITLESKPHVQTVFTVRLKWLANPPMPCPRERNS